MRSKADETFVIVFSSPVCSLEDEDIAEWGLAPSEDIPARVYQRSNKN